MTSFQVQQWLRQGIAAAKAGQIERARELLLQVVDADEYNEQGWLWLSSVVETDEDREICLENVIAINPDNKLAKTGLVHLRNRRKAVVPPPEPEPVAPPPAKPPETAPADWWAKPAPATPQPEAAPDQLLEGRRSAAAAAPTATPVAEPAPPEPVPAEKDRPRRAPRDRQLSLRRLAIALCLVLGLTAGGVAVAAGLQVGPFSPGDRDYIEAMTPLLERYDAWWTGAYGALVGELNDSCGPGADGWTNRDVLVVCSQQPAVECALLAAHCKGDVEAMREKVSDLAAGAQSEGRAMLRALETVVPPDDVATAHWRFVACIEAQVAAAAQAGELAQGRALGDAVSVPACQMFPSAEREVRAYVGRE